MSDSEKITKMTVARAKKMTRDAIIWDSEIKGFGIRVRKGGSRRYILKYRHIVGGQRWLTLGNVDSLELDDARIAAKKAVARIADGEDPAETKRIGRIERKVALEEIAEGIVYTASASTFGELADLMMAARMDYAASTRDNYERWLRLHIKPEIGDIPAVDLTTSRIQRIVDNIKKNHPTTARRIKEVVAAVWKWATETEVDGVYYLDPELRNPVKRVKVPPPNEIDNVMTADDVSIVWDALDTIEDKNVDIVVGEALAIVRLAILTGARKDELRLLRPDQVDVGKGLIVLQRHEHKTGRQQKEGGGVKRIAVPAAAMELIKPRLEDDKRTYVFRGRKLSKPMAKTQPWKAWQDVLTIARKDSQFLKGRIRFHDIRHSFASVGLSLGMGLAEIGEMLGHRDVRTTQRYAHLVDGAKIDAAERIAENMLSKK